MFRIQKTRINQVAFILLVIGVALTALSALNGSAFLVILGVSVAFWSVLLLYLAPSKHVSLALLNASASTGGSNIERSLMEFDLTEKGIYLPPRNLRNYDYSLVFVPKTPHTPLPEPDKTSDKLFTKEKTGLFLTPPGFALSMVFERELGLSFTKIDLTQMQTMIARLIQKLEFAKDAQVRVQDRTITLEVTDSVFNTLCQETSNSQPRTHAQVGCVLASAFACAFAKASGRPIIIQKDVVNPDNETLIIEYGMKEV
jgi:hypothetical protein